MPEEEAKHEDKSQLAAPGQQRLQAYYKYLRNFLDQGKEQKTNRPQENEGGERVPKSGEAHIKKEVKFKTPDKNKIEAEQSEAEQQADEAAAANIVAQTAADESEKLATEKTDEKNKKQVEDDKGEMESELPNNENEQAKAMHAAAMEEAKRRGIDGPGPMSFDDFNKQREKDGEDDKKDEGDKPKEENEKEEKPKEDENKKDTDKKDGEEKPKEEVDKEGDKKDGDKEGEKPKTPSEEDGDKKPGSDEEETPTPETEKESATDKPETEVEPKTETSTETTPDKTSSPSPPNLNPNEQEDAAADMMSDRLNNTEQEEEQTEGDRQSLSPQADIESRGEQDEQDIAADMKSEQARQKIQNLEKQKNSLAKQLTSIKTDIAGSLKSGNHALLSKRLPFASIFTKRILGKINKKLKKASKNAKRLLKALKWARKSLTVLLYTLRLAEAMAVMIDAFWRGSKQYWTKWVPEAAIAYWWLIFTAILDILFIWPAFIFGAFVYGSTNPGKLTRLVRDMIKQITKVRRKIKNLIKKIKPQVQILDQIDSIEKAEEVVKKQREQETRR